jgi:hypothetical protein
MGLASAGADLTDMPPEKSPMPQKAAAKRAKMELEGMVGMVSKTSSISC